MADPNYRYNKEHRTLIPTGVYFSAEHVNFYDADGCGMGDDFFRRWSGLKSAFPPRVTSLTQDER